VLFWSYLKTKIYGVSDVGTLEDKLKWCYVAPPYITSLAT